MDCDHSMMRATGEDIEATCGGCGLVIGKFTCPDCGLVFTVESAYVSHRGEHA